ncbi:MAG: hypothetical protein IKA61_04950 [Clostridia bacterium]|nr:hypothetical protein [Clostridia bacterium]
MAKFKFTKKQFEEASADKQQEGTAEEESEEKKKLKEKLGEIDSEYKSAPNRTYNGIAVPNVEEKTYEMPSDEQVAKKADEEISPLYDAKIQSLNSESEFQRESVENEKDELYQRAEQSLKELKKTYDKARENTSDEAIKRGLARSSIILNQLKDLENSEINATGGILSQRDKDLSALSKKIDEIKLKLLNDTNVLNEERAKEINERLEELLEKYRAEEKEVIEYNNKLKAQKAETLAKLKSAGIIANETNSEEYANMIAKKTKALYSYYFAFGKNALDEIKKDRQFIIENVGEKGYDSLVRYYE